MVDNFAIGLTHMLLLIAAWRLLSRADLDQDLDDATSPRRPGARPGRRQAGIPDA